MIPKIGRDVETVFIMGVATFALLVEVDRYRPQKNMRDTDY